MEIPAALILVIIVILMWKFYPRCDKVAMHHGAVAAGGGTVTSNVAVTPEVAAATPVAKAVGLTQTPAAIESGAATSTKPAVVVAAPVTTPAAATEHFKIMDEIRKFRKQFGVGAPMAMSERMTMMPKDQAFW